LKEIIQETTDEISKLSIRASEEEEKIEEESPKPIVRKVRVNQMGFSKARVHQANTIKNGKRKSFAEELKVQKVRRIKPKREGKGDDE
jgi:hypothetical protein